MRFVFALTIISASTLNLLGAEPALAEVNAYRAKKGLRPFIEDPSLTVAAMGAADFRARHLLFGHTSNDFRFVPTGAKADAAGCAAYPPRYGWMSCCADDDYTYAGAAWTMGADGKRYCHLFVRGGSGRSLTGKPSLKSTGRASSFLTTASNRPFRRLFR